jgi:signal transduction histidine kinase
MTQAAEQGAPAASGKVMLVQEIDDDKQPGLLIYVPVYLGEQVPQDAASRKAMLRGFAYTPLRIPDVLQGVRGTGVRQVDFELYDGPRPVSDALMHSTRDPAAGAPSFESRRTLQVGGRTWTLHFASRPEFEALSQKRLVPALAAMSVIGSLLLAWITFVQSRARREAEASAMRRSADARALAESEAREKERAGRLEEAYRQLREADRRKDEFLAVLAHELRNPLAPIRNALEIIRIAPSGDAAARARQVASRQLAHMVRLIDDLLDISRISRGKIVLQRRRVPLRSVVDAAVETSRPLIESRRHHLGIGEVDDALEVEVDPDRMAQVFTNLLNNAANYTPEGGLIELSCGRVSEGVRVAVRDNGIGIEPEKLREVFDLFVQLASHSAGGLGIGLSLASQLVQLHGGRIDASSEGPGRGSEFAVTLPLAG